MSKHAGIKTCRWCGRWCCGDQRRALPSPLTHRRGAATGDCSGGSRPGQVRPLRAGPSVQPHHNWSTRKHNNVPNKTRMKASLLDIMNNGNKNDPKEDFCIVFKFSCAYMYRGVNNIVYVSRREINKDVNYIFIERGKKKKKQCIQLILLKNWP